MNNTDDLVPKQRHPEPKPSDTDEARRLIKEYADDLREYIRKLRQKMN